MSRNIVCRKCARGDLSPAADWSVRCVWLVVRKRKEHVVKEIIGGNVVACHELESILCDFCNQRLADGDVALAVSHIPPGRQIGPWEEGYGDILTDEAVRAMDVLSGERANREK